MANSSKINEIYEKIKRLEEELKQEYEKNKDNFHFRKAFNKFQFDKDYINKYKSKVINSFKYLWRERAGIILTIPIIWSVLIPAFLLDIFVTLYQNICFPIYRIPKVNRKEYIIIDRYNLFYLNKVQQINCLYCEYFNGLIGYVREVAGRTEQYWCPIKHAEKMKDNHSRYDKFFDYGDAKAYQENNQEVRENFKDIKKEK
ncbi:hypothetical protein CPU12_02320 [Malaciobacter molluscorum LMG 25693]|uniref:Uncharacterized protein n=1 Tax=Malaciobacter molluscorum LMG 25693 TaxID=870501 RepID=A0A2G1DKV0_9BACT|nr:hypothetical protein [Malaciobacter molluscorum]AXX92682.1 hypothetical protein AMOL_1717 [Malaciobacter molluscorum LMG 25693]PHO19100.1 hypothetical protein CPU12_02320 [Malaciobacter molluscorum LMG 25693]